MIAAMSSRAVLATIVVLMLVDGIVHQASAQGGGQTATQDAGDGRGVPTSQFATYIGRRELLVYPFYEYYRDKDFEYKPSEFGFANGEDQRGRFRAHEGLLYLAYGLTSNVMVEFEIATIRASLERARGDISAFPARRQESGLGDVEGQVRWRWRGETARGPEVFSYSEVVVPHKRDQPLIGTSGWQLKYGTGVIRSFSWGTITARGAIEYDAGSTSKFDSGEYAVEYMRDVRRWRFYAGVEGVQDELALITEAQWRVVPHVVVKINNGFALTSKAIDYAPEIGILFTSKP